MESSKKQVEAPIGPVGIHARFINDISLKHLFFSFSYDQFIEATLKFNGMEYFSKCSLVTFGDLMVSE